MHAWFGLLSGMTLSLRLGLVWPSSQLGCSGSVCATKPSRSAEHARFDFRPAYAWREPDEEYLEDCVEPTFIPGFKRVKVWGAIQYGKKSKLVVIPENIEKGKKLNTETYIQEIMDKELFDFWQEAMEDCGHVMVMEDGAPPHMGIAEARRRQLMEYGWEGFGPGTWPSCSPDLNP